MAGDLRERYTTLPRYLADAVTMAAFAVACQLRRSMRTSRIFEPSWMGLLITTIGYFGGLFRPPAAPDVPGVAEFLYGTATGIALAYFLRNTAEHTPSGRPAPRPLWAVGVVAALLGVQAALFVFNAVYGPDWMSYPGGWTMTITMLAMSAVFVQRQSIPVRNSDDRP
jgi:hypothetical protein